ncbi:hypothetical protein H5410_021680 [Solanum commersonii]|uniref:Uncharacterized protein n=1 Tax=Solanum commersonii TaxID=4109 RepID=A0A9J5ZEM7_SOLCO|nr:hypothetical protein H5410_021680 [Solanum commersonii]
MPLLLSLSAATRATGISVVLTPTDTTINYRESAPLQYRQKEMKLSAKGSLSRPGGKKSREQSGELIYEGTPKAKVALWVPTDAEVRKHGERTGLDTLEHEVRIATNRGSACRGEYVTGPCRHRPSHPGNWFRPKHQTDFHP